MYFIAWTDLRDVASFSQFGENRLDSLGRMYIVPCTTIPGDRERSDCGWGCRVARSRNEICVTRGPTSPGLAPLLLSSAQLGAVQFCAREKGGTLYYSIMSFELYARARAPRCDGDRESK